LTAAWTGGESEDIVRAPAGNTDHKRPCGEAAAEVDGATSTSARLAGTDAIDVIKAAITFDCTQPRQRRRWPQPQPSRGGFECDGPGWIRYSSHLWPVTTKNSPLVQRGPREGRPIRSETPPLRTTGAGRGGGPRYALTARGQKHTLRELLDGVDRRKGLSWGPET